MKSLVLFDIDGTLVRKAGPHHREALIEAVHRVTGLKTTTDDVPVQGMLDGDILSQMLASAGQGTDALPAIIEAAQDIYQTSVPDLREKLCPGVAPLLVDFLELLEGVRVLDRSFEARGEQCDVR